MYKRFKNGFTLSEILITLGIIGVVAAITIPVIIQNYKKHVVEIRLKKAYATLSQSIEISKSQHGDIADWYWDDKYPRPFIENYILKNINYIKKINRDSRYNSSYLIYMSDGVTIDIHFTGNNYLLQFEIDTNGENPPNEPGRDRFYFYLTNGNSYSIGYGAGEVARVEYKAGFYYDGYGLGILNGTGNRGCNSNATESSGYYCTGVIVRNSWKIPNDYPFKF